MGHKLESNQYDHLDSFIADAQLVFDNCKIYNPEGSVYHKSAIKLEKFLKDQLRDRIKKEEQ
jgi:histone acetyltransferase